MGKSINDIFIDGGEKFPFRIRAINDKPDRYFHIVAISPVGDWIGWFSDFSPDHFSAFCDGPVWEKVDL